MRAVKTLCRWEMSLGEAGAYYLDVLEFRGQTYKGLSTGLKLVDFHSVARVSMCTK